MRVRRVVGAAVAGLVVASLPVVPASASGTTDLQLDSGTSAVPLSTRVVGASTAGVLVAKGGYGASPAAFPGSQELRTGATTKTLPASFDGTSYFGSLNGTYAVALSGDATHVAFDDLSTDSTGTVAIAPTSYLLAAGPHGWVEFDYAARTATYVTPTGTGTDAPVTRTVLKTYGYAGETWNASGSANQQGVLLTASCVSCGTGSVAEVLPFDGSPGTTLIDPTAGMTAPSTQTTTGPAQVAALSCPTSTTCFGVDAAGSFLATTDATAGAASWSHSPLATGVDATAVSCPTTTFCVTSDRSGQIRTSTDPTAATPAWTTGAQTSPFAQLACPTVSLCVGRDTWGGVSVTTTPADPGATWTPASSLSSASGISCPATTLCLAVDGSSVYATTTPTDATSWGAVSTPATNPTGVSCTSTTLCVVSDGSGSAYESTAPTTTSWTQQLVDAADYLVGIECDGTSCLVAGGNGGLYRNGDVANGSTWTPVDPGGTPQATECSGSTCVVAVPTGMLATSTNGGASFGAPGAVGSPLGAEIDALSCPTSTRCYLLDAVGRLRKSDNGGASFSDAGSQPPFTGTGLVCPTVDSCLVYNGGTDIATTSSTTTGPWYTTSTSGGAAVTAASCPGTSCLLATDQGDVVPVSAPFTSAPSAGTPQPSGLAYLTLLSCSGTGCLASDGSSLVATSGGSWHAVSTGLGNVSLLTCASASLCLAGDGSSALTVGSPASTAFTDSTNPNIASFSAVSCATSSLCAATTQTGGLAISTLPASGAASFGYPSATGLTAAGYGSTVLLSCADPTRCLVGGHFGKVVTDADVTTLVSRQVISGGIDAGGDAALSMVPLGASSGAEVQRYTAAGLESGTAFGISGGSPPVVTPTRVFWADYGQVLHVHPSLNGSDVVSPNAVSSEVPAPDGIVWGEADGSIRQLADADPGPTTLYAGTAEPTAASGVALSAGRVAYVDDDANGYTASEAATAMVHQPVWSRSLSDLPGNLTDGTATLVAHTATGASLGISGTRTVVQDRAQDAYVVQTGSATPVKVPTASPFWNQRYSSARGSFSGTSLLFPSYDTNGLSWQLLDVVTKAQRTLASGGTWLAAHLSGRYVSAVKTDGSVVRLDLATNATTPVAPAPVLDPGESVGSAQVDSDAAAAAWVVQVYGSSQSRAVGGYVRSAGDPVQPLTFGTGPTQDRNPEVAISQEYLVRTTADRTGLTATPLSGGSTFTVAATTPGIGAGNAYDLPLDSDADTVAFEAADGTGHVVQLPAVTDAPYVLGDASVHAYTMGSGRTWAADVVTSRPLTGTCAFTIALGATTVRSLPCDPTAMAAGEATAVWDGKNASSAVVAPGTYTWTLTASGTDGALRRSDLTAGTTTGTVTVANVDTVAKVTAAATTTSPFVVTLARDAYGASGSNIRLRLSTSTSDLGESLSCLSSTSAAVSCAGPFRSVKVTPTSPLVPGASYRVLVNPSGTTTPVKDSAGVAVASYTSAAMRVLTADDPATTQAWSTLATSKALGGSVLRERRVGATFSTTFTGAGVRYWFLKGPDAGRVKVTIDGVTKDTALDEYASSVVRSYRTYTGLTSSAHRLVVTVLGTKATAATNTFGSVDAISTATATCSTSTGCTMTPSGTRWATAATTGALGSRAAVSDVLGATLSRTFVGTGFDLYRLIGPAQGYLALYVDGHYVASYDGYATSNAVRAITRTGLASGTHTVVVRVLHQAGKTGTAAFAVTVDRLTAR